MATDYCVTLAGRKDRDRAGRVSGAGESGHEAGRAVCGASRAVVCRQVYSADATKSGAGDEAAFAAGDSEGGGDASRGEVYADVHEGEMGAD